MCIYIHVSTSLCVSVRVCHVYLCPVCLCVCTRVHVCILHILIALVTSIRQGDAVIEQGLEKSLENFHWRRA